MFGIRNRMLGLDIGSCCVKWIVYGGHRRNPTVFDWGRVKISPGIVRDGRITDIKGLQEKMKEILDFKDIKIDRASITVSCPEMVIRTVEMPTLKQKEMEPVIKYELEQLIPMNAEEYVTDYKILGHVENNGTELLRILLAAIPNRIVQDYIRLIEGMDMKPVVVDFHGDSVSRFLKENQPGFQDSSYMLVDVGASSTTVTITEKGVPVFTRLIQRGSDEITRSLTNSFNLSLDDGEKYKKMHGRIFGKDQQAESGIIEKIRTSIMPVIEYQLNDIYRSIQFYKDRKNKDVDSLLLIGGGSYLKQLDEFFAEQLNLNKAVISKNASIKFNKDMPVEQMVMYANVLGLAFREER